MTLSMRSALAALAAAAIAAVLVPPAADAATAAKVICKDGTTDEGGRGACSGHGGVDKAATSKAQGGTSEAKAAGEPKAEKATKAKKEKAGDAPKGTVVCKDGTTDEAGRGACSGHGGVDKSAGAKAQGGAATPATPATPATHAEPASPAHKASAAEHEKADPAKGPPTARCKDGTLSYAEHHTGACSRHGGVEEWLDKK